MPSLRLLLLAIGLWLAATTAVQGVIGQPVPPTAYQEGEVLVRFKNGLSHDARTRVLNAAGCQETRAIELVPGLSRAQIVSVSRWLKQSIGCAPTRMFCTPSPTSS